MALALKCKVIPVSSLHALKNGNQKSICLINARSGRSYVGVYEGNNVLIKDTIWKNDEVLEYIKINPDTCVCGATTYLKLEGFESNIAEELLSLKESYPEVSQAETLKPIYMKD
jgi:tRNA A37 threonylcarbamoyladenosine modification protein TsaB